MIFKNTIYIYQYIINLNMNNILNNYINNILIPLRLQEGIQKKIYVPFVLPSPCRKKTVYFMGRKRPSGVLIPTFNFVLAVNILITQKCLLWTNFKPHINIGIPKKKLKLSSFLFVSILPANSKIHNLVDFALNICLSYNKDKILKLAVSIGLMKIDKFNLRAYIVWHIKFPYITVKDI